MIDYIILQRPINDRITVNIESSLLPHINANSSINNTSNHLIVWLEKWNYSDGDFSNFSYGNIVYAQVFIINFHLFYKCYFIYVFHQNILYYIIFLLLEFKWTLGASIISFRTYWLFTWKKTAEYIHTEKFDKWVIIIKYIYIIKIVVMALNTVQYRISQRSLLSEGTYPV